MTDLTEDQKRVLQCIDEFGGNPEDLRSDLRCAFFDLETLGLIERIKGFRLTEVGQRVASAMTNGDRT